MRHHKSCSGRALSKQPNQRYPTGGGLIHHSDCSSQYLSICHTKRLADAGIVTSVRSLGDGNFRLYLADDPVQVGEEFGRELS